MSTRQDFEAFVSQLPIRIRESHIWPNAPGNASAHDPMALAIRDWLAASGLTRVTLYGEGLKHLGIATIPAGHRDGFCSSWNWPDIALFHDEVTVAIEVDRARGTGGASVRNAMTKGSFNTQALGGKFDRCEVFVFHEPGCRLKIGPEADLILARYRDDFRTAVHFLERATAAN